MPIRYLYSVLIIVICLKPGLAQNEIVFNKSMVGFQSGLNVSNFKCDTNAFSNGGKPFIGFFSISEITEDLYLSFTASYSLRSFTATTPYYKIENNYIESDLTLNLKLFNRLFIKTGINYSYIFASNKLELLGENENGVEKVPFEYFGNYLSIPLGLELAFTNDFFIFCNYYLIAKRNQLTNIQFGLKYSIFSFSHPVPFCYYREKNAE